MVTVYVLKSRGQAKRYVGITGNLARRLAEHASGSTRAGQLLGEFLVLHTEDLPDHATARMRERFLKSGQGRKWLDELEGVSWPAKGG